MTSLFSLLSSSRLLPLAGGLSRPLLLLLVARDALLGRLGGDGVVGHELLLGRLLSALDVRVGWGHARRGLPVATRVCGVLGQAVAGLGNLVAIGVDDARARFVARAKLHLAFERLDLLLVQKIAVLVPVLDALLARQDALAGRRGRAGYPRRPPGGLLDLTGRRRHGSHRHLGRGRFGVDGLLRGLGYGSAARRQGCVRGVL